MLKFNHHLGSKVISRELLTHCIKWKLCTTRPNADLWRKEEQQIVPFTSACTRNTDNRLIGCVHLQVFGRFLILFAVLRPSVEIHEHPIVYVLFLVWSLIEIFRYVSDTDTHC